VRDCTREAPPLDADGGEAHKRYPETVVWCTCVAGVVQMHDGPWRREVPWGGAGVGMEVGSVSLL